MAPIRNPFIAGGPVSPEVFIGRAKEINGILNRITNVRPSSSSIYGEARVGKTSLLHYLKSDQVFQDWELAPDKFTFCFIDCGGIDQPFAFNFWRTMIERLKNNTQNAQVSEQLANFSLNRKQPN